MRSMPAIDGYRVVLRRLADELLDAWPGAVAHADPEHLHDLRIATRKTRVVLAAGRDVLPRSALRRMTPFFAELSDLTGEPRDLDVYLLGWDAAVGPAGADLAPVRRLLEEQCAAAHARLRAGLESAAAGEAMTWWLWWLYSRKGARDHGPASHRHTGKVAARQIGHAYQRLLTHGRAIHEDATDEQLHDLRKDAKKLRYLLECFADVLPSTPRQHFVAGLKELQDHLGAHQDAAVQAARLQAIAVTLGGPPTSVVTLEAVETLVRRLDDQREIARGASHAHVAAFDTSATADSMHRMLKRARRH